MADSLKLLEQDLRLGADAASKERAPVPADKVRQLLTAIADRLTALPKQEWRPIAEAPRDGSPVAVIVRHENYGTALPSERDRWQEIVIAKWIAHNGGGWTWQGICGKPIACSPLPPPPTVAEREG